MRILNLMAALGSAVLMLSSISLAQSVQQGSCENPQTQIDMNICAGQSLRAADGDLNADYKMARDAMRRLDSYLEGGNKRAEKTLLTAQRAWIKYRDGACDAEGLTVQGGSMAPLVVAGCLERLTRQRSEDLRRLFEIN